VLFRSLEPGALEEIERLLAFKVDRRPALELLVAGPAAVAMHWQEARDGVKAGAILVHSLDAASQEDLIGYLDWRLGRFEMQRLMTPVALQMIARLSGGRYAAADVLCQMSLLLLRQLTLDRADARVVRQAVTTLVNRQNAKLDTDKPRSAAQEVAPPP